MDAKKMAEAFCLRLVATATLLVSIKEGDEKYGPVPFFFTSHGDIVKGDGPWGHAHIVQERLWALVQVGREMGIIQSPPAADELNVSDYNSIVGVAALGEFLRLARRQK